MARLAKTATLLIADLDALVSAAAVAPAHPALLHCRVVVARVVVARWGVRVAYGHAVALVLFHLHVKVVFQWCKARPNKKHGEHKYVSSIFQIIHHTGITLTGATNYTCRHKPVEENRR